MIVNETTGRTQNKHSKIVNREHQIKNHNYYHNNYDIWNNPHQSSPKNYKFYHLGQEQQRSHVQERTQDHYKYLNHLQDQTRKQLIQDREEDQQRLITRKSERMNLQSQTQQKGMWDPFIKNQSVSRVNHTLTGRADFSWNKYSELSNKYMRAACTPKILLMEDNAIKQIQTKINKDDYEEEQRQIQRAEAINEQRDLFLFQHQRNYDKELIYGLVPEIKPSIIKIKPTHSSKFIDVRASTSQGSRNDQQDAIQATFQFSNSKNSTTKHSQRQINLYQSEYVRQADNTLQKSQGASIDFQVVQKDMTNSQTVKLYKSPLVNFPQKYVNYNDMIKISHASERTNQLACTKKIRLISPRSRLQRTEFRGLLKADYEGHVKKNPERHTETAYSQLKCDPQQRRDSKQGSSQVQNYIDYTQAQVRNDPESIMAMSEINQFEKKTGYQKSKVGFPNISLKDLNIQ